jgi:hypothetical protein
MHGIIIHQVKEHHEIKYEFILAKSNLIPAEIYLRIGKLSFFIHIAHMDPSCLPIQVINSQVNANGKCS